MKVPRLSLEVGDPASLQADLLTVGVFQDDPTPSPVQDLLNRALGGLLEQIAREEGFEGRPESLLLLRTHGLGLGGPRRILLMGLGNRLPPRPDLVKDMAGVASREARRYRGTSVAMAALAFPKPETVLRWIRPWAEGALLGAYRYDQLKEGNNAEPALEEVKLLVWPPPTKALLGEIRRQLEIVSLDCEAVYLARDMVNEPANMLYPESMAARAEALFQGTKVECSVLDHRAMEELGMGLILAVGGASIHKPRMVILSYRPSSPVGSHLALVGKGITFDSGGLSIKPPKSMETMKADMAGAAAILAAMTLVDRLEPPFPITAVLPLAENMVGPQAIRPGDVITSLAKKTVEVKNTDAEGRLILADALTHARSLGAQEIIDVATLTGSCKIALGDFTAGLLGNNKELVGEVKAAADNALEDVWPLPMTDRLKKGLRSSVANLSNVSDDRGGGTIVAAHFLREFVEDARWAHLDIAGPSFLSVDLPFCPRGGTGFGVLTLASLLRRRAAGRLGEQE